MSSISVDDMIADALEAAQMFEYQEAANKLTLALSHFPDNTNVMDHLGELLIETGNIDDAQLVLNRSIELNPDEGHSKYMLIAQISEPKSAVEAYRKGIELIEGVLNSQQNHEDSEGLYRQIVSALVAISEIYMTDLCDEPEAEETCEQCLLKAVSILPDHWEGHQAKADFHLSQQKNDEAAKEIMLSYSLWKDLEPEDIDRPTFEQRIRCSQILIEVGDFGTVVEVLEALLEDEDDNSSTWYWLAYSYNELKLGEEAFECAVKAKKYLTKQKKTRDPLFSAVTDLLEIIPFKGDESEIDIEIPSPFGDAQMTNN